MFGVFGNFLCFPQVLVFSPIFGDLMTRGILVHLGFQFVASILRDQAVLEPCKALQLLGAVLARFPWEPPPLYVMFPSKPPFLGYTR